MKRSTERILTTHVGSLVRPPEIVDIMRRRERMEPFSESDLNTLRKHVTENVRMQVDCGIDIPNDGEYSKSSFSGYAAERLSGFEEKPGSDGFALYRGRDRARFADAYEEITRMEQAQTERGAANQTGLTVVCTSAIKYVGQKLVENDIANFKAALQGLKYEEPFMPAVAPGTIELQRRNLHYPSQEEYLFAIAEAMKTEYKMIVDAGFVLQIDDPRVVVQFDMHEVEPTKEEYRKFANLRVEALNHALAGLPEDRIRYHLCWGSWHGPHTTDVPLKDIVDIVLSVRAGAVSVEAANPRHEHEYHVWEDVKLPEGKFLIPGVVAHTTNCVEHPELIAERIMNYAKIVGRENVVAGVDCGFAQGAFTRRVPASIMWEKFRMLRKGADIATKKLWR
jgi:5-methyltetrahydropteroyltriglutamate--homocysteine methyltransferase